MSANVVVVYDDTVRVPDEVAAMTGVRNFGHLLRGRERLSTRVAQIVREAGLPDPRHAETVPSLRDVADGARRLAGDDLYLLLPSCLVPTVATRDASLFLRKLVLFGEPVGLSHRERPLSLAIVDRGRLEAYVASVEEGDEDRRRFAEDHLAGLPQVPDALGLADLRDATAALEFLSSSFSARHFNHVVQDRHHVVKRSSDRDKIRREYRFYQLLPEAMQPYFLQPFGFAEEADGASYRTRRLLVPDLAVQWVHHAFTEGQFRKLLAHLMHFMAERPRRDVGRAALRDVAAELYVAKTRSRVQALLDTAAGRAVDATLTAGGVEGGVAGLLARYERLYESVSAQRKDRELCISHGDMAFSNILYSATSQDFRLIDPRGADTEDELYSDPLYDFAKLSHSILGGYDMIVAGLFDLVHDEDLRLSVQLSPGPDPALQGAFVEALETGGQDVRQVRLSEAALFLSMLPLHIDVPKRVAAFALTAKRIIEDLEEAA